MKTTTKRVVLACTLITAISLGSVGAAYASVPEPATPAAAAAQATWADGVTFKNLTDDQLSAAAKAALEKSLADLDAKIKAGQSDAELTAARADLIAKLGAAKTSAGIYLTALNDLTQTYSTYNPALPAWLTKDLSAAQTALDKALAAGASDADVKALTVKVEAWLTLIKDWRPANTQAVNAIQQTATLVGENRAPYATATAIAAVSKAQSVLGKSAFTDGTAAAQLNQATAAAHTAIEAAKRSSAERGAAVIAAHAATKNGTSTVALHSATAAPSVVAAWKAANTKLVNAINTATPAQLTTLTKTVKDNTILVAKAGAAVTNAKKLLLSSAASLKSHPKATAAQKAAVAKAAAALNAGVKARYTPEKLAPLVKSLTAAVGKLAK